MACPLCIEYLPSQSVLSAVVMRIHGSQYESEGLAITVYIYTVHDRIFGDFPAKVTVYTPYIYVSGQPYKSSFQDV
jgi:hypothetical protein